MRGTIAKALGLGLMAILLALPGTVRAAEAEAPPSRDWSFDGMFGSFDRGEVKRGYQVYREVCAGCHALSLIYFRNLLEIGFEEKTIKAIAAEYEVQNERPNDEGEMFMRPAKLSDRLPSPFPNEAAARAANNGAHPPDLSLITKARKGGANYIYALLTSFHVEPPADFLERYRKEQEEKDEKDRTEFKLGEGMSFNTYFPGHQIAMVPPLSEDAVEFADGTKATIENMARDVTAFLAWTAEPELEARKGLGIKVLMFLLVLTAMLYAVKRKIWLDLH